MLFSKRHYASICIMITLILCPFTAEDQTVEKSHSTSVAGMVKLVLLEAKLIDNLRSYTDGLEKKLKILKSVVPRLRAESDKAMNQMEHYMSNPLNAFSLIRRMHEDWVEWMAFMKTSGGYHAAFINWHKAQLPSPSDMEEACEAIHRLRCVYNLTVMDMATGRLNGKQHDSSLNALDSYALGQHLHKHKKPILAREWFDESKKWLMEHTLPTPIGAEPEKMLKLFAGALNDYKYYSIALPIFDSALMIGNKTRDPKLLKKRATIEKLVEKETDGN